MSESRLVICPACNSINRVPVSKIRSAPSCGRCSKPLFHGEPLDVDAAAFDRHVGRGSLPVLVDFWASWCGPCRVMAPAFKAAAADLEPEFRLLKLDTEAQQNIAARYNIRSIPTMILFKDGKEIARQSGAMDRSRLVGWAKQALSSA